MSRPLSRPRRNARRFFALLVLLAAGAGLWWFVASFKARVQTEKSQAQTSLVELRSGERRLMGTTAEIILFAPDEETGRAAIEKAFARAEEINDICSDYSPESELMRLCREPVNKPIAVSETLAEVLTHARTIAELTEGAFDPTLGGYSKLWRKSKRKKELPDPILLERARQSSGWEKFEVDLENFTVVIKDENLLLDLGGIAKGYAADEMLRVINGHGITSAMVAVAGDIRLGAPPPARPGWAVGIRTLGATIEQIIHVANCAVSTSGDVERHVEIGGQRYSHIIDPETGLGLSYRIAATVVAPTSVQSDPLATFCCIRPELALKVFAAGEISCRVVGLAGGPYDRRTQQFPSITLP